MGKFLKSKNMEWHWYYTFICIVGIILILAALTNPPQNRKPE